jgi:hypothetical protein
MSLSISRAEAARAKHAGKNLAKELMSAFGYKRT